MKQLLSCQPTEKHRHCPLGVNLAGISVWNHPGQSQKNLWVKHAIKKVDQHIQIISKKRQVVVTTIEAGTSLTVKEYRQVQGAKKVAELMSSVDKKEMKESLLVSIYTLY